MGTVSSFSTGVKYPQRRSRSAWMRRETKAARFHRTRGWRPKITAAVAEARARQLPLVTWLRPKPPEGPDPGPSRIPVDQEGRALAGAVVDAYLESRHARADA